MKSIMYKGQKYVAAEITPSEGPLTIKKGSAKGVHHNLVLELKEKNRLVCRANVDFDIAKGDVWFLQDVYNSLKGKDISFNFKGQTYTITKMAKVNDPNYYMVAAVSCLAGANYVPLADYKPEITTLPFRNLGETIITFKDIDPSQLKSNPPEDEALLVIEKLKTNNGIKIEYKASPTLEEGIPFFYDAEATYRDVDLAPWLKAESIEKIEEKILKKYESESGWKF